MPRKKRLTAFILIFFLSGIYVFIFGESGLLERLVLEKKRAGFIENIADLKEENKRLRELLNRYSEGRLSEKDILDSGFTAGDERILSLHGVKDQDDKVREPADVLESTVRLSHVRIIWVVVSMLILLFYFSRKEKREEAEDNAY